MCGSIVFVPWRDLPCCLRLSSDVLEWAPVFPRLSSSEYLPHSREHGVREEEFYSLTHNAVWQGLPRRRGPCSELSNTLVNKSINFSQKSSTWFYNILPFSITLPAPICNSTLVYLYFHFSAQDLIFPLTDRVPVRVSLSSKMSCVAYSFGGVTAYQYCKSLR